MLRILLTLLLALEAATLVAKERPAIDFARDIRPLFQQHCYACHGSEQQESNYRLDDRDIAYAGGDLGEPAIVPRDSDASPLVRYVTSATRPASDELRMPPDGKGTPLSSDEIVLVRRWIDEGAVWPDELSRPSRDPPTTDHWSFQPVSRPSIPLIDDRWVLNGIDGFILERLHAEGLSPSPSADRETLIRRVHLTALGLPPTPDDVQRFLADRQPNAYERMVEEVLARPQFGERWAQHWLDIARYGESDGFETNRERMTSYHYRDYVVQAFNTDKPYDQFVIDQLAGDTLGSGIGTGFLVAGPTDIVKSPDINLTLMQRQDELADMVNTTGTAFLGITIGCARCHNHKFDPILQSDFYAMQAVFAGVEFGERPIETNASQPLEQRLRALEEQQHELQRRLAELPLRAPVQPQQNEERFDPILARYVRFTIRRTTGAEPCLDELEIYSAVEPGNESSANVALSDSGAIASASGTLPGYAIHQLAHINDGRTGNDHSWISDTPGTGWIQIALPQPVRINRIVWGRDRNGAFGDRLATDYQIEVALEEGAWHTIASSDDRLPVDALSSPVDKQPALQSLTPEQRTEVRTLMEQRRELNERIAVLKTELAGLEQAYVGKFTAPPTIHRLHRGDPLAPREVVAPNTVTVLGSLELDNETQEPQRRAALARSLVDRGNPLTARVIVNRLWQHHFGRGIVATSSDFGAQGIPPTHPQLLDWLASYLIDHDWSLKSVHRLILLSNCYRQSSRPRPDCLERDADCRLWWRFRPRRLEAEAIRDSILHVSGALDPRIGGHGFYALQVIRENVHHYYPKDEFSPADFRRMLYAVKIRQERDGEFGAFDCPDGGQLIPNRSVSTTPLQALNLLNSSFMLQQADLLAERLHHEDPDDMPRQITRAYQLAYARVPSDKELVLARTFVASRGLAAFCRAVLNSNEFLFVP